MDAILALKKWLYPTYLHLHYSLVRQKRTLQRAIFKKQPPVYLFILSPSFAGSTVLHELLSTSGNVSPNNTIGTREGQQLPRVRAMMWDHADRWNPDREYDWPFIKREWLKYWDATRTVLLEKSPSNIVRVEAIDQHFNPARYIFLVRNPYANAEGFIRRNVYAPAQAAEFVIRMMYLQKKNLAALEHTLLLSYETLTDHPEDAKDLLLNFLPALAELDHTGTFRAHNMLAKKLPITNLNKPKVRQLTRRQLDEMNGVFKAHVPLITYFGYSIYESKEELLTTL